MTHFTAEIRDELERLKQAYSELHDKLEELMPYLPILQEAYAGKIGGTSEAVNEHFDKLGAVDIETAKAALEAVPVLQETGLTL